MSYFVRTNYLSQRIFYCSNDLLIRTNEEYFYLMSLRRRKLTILIKKRFTDFAKKTFYVELLKNYITQGELQHP